MPPPLLLTKDLKRTEKNTNKPKFLDVYSKYMPKHTEYKKAYKIAETKPLTSEKHLKTEAN